MSGLARMSGYTDEDRGFESSDNEDDYKNLTQNIQNFKKKQKRTKNILDEGSKSNENTFLDTKNYPLNKHFPRVVDNLREKMLEQRQVVNKLGAMDWHENKNNLEKSINLGKEVRKAHTEAIGTHQFTGKNGEQVSFKIGREGSFGNKIRFVENPINGKKLHLSTDAGSFHKNPVGIKNKPSAHSLYHQGGRKTRRHRLKRKVSRKAKRHQKSKRARKVKRSKSKRKTRRRRR